MACSDYFNPDKFYSYAKWAGILSTLVLWIFCIWKLFSVPNAWIIMACIAGIIFGVMMVFLEIPFCTKCCDGPRAEKYREFFAKPILRALLYAVFAVVMWVSLLAEVSTLIVPAIFLSFTSFFYMCSICRKGPQKTTPVPKDAGDQADRLV